MEGLCRDCQNPSQLFLANEPGDLVLLKCAACGAPYELYYSGERLRKEKVGLGSLTPDPEDRFGRLVSESEKIISLWKEGEYMTGDQLLYDLFERDFSWLLKLAGERLRPENKKEEGTE